MDVLNSDEQGLQVFVGIRVPNCTQHSGYYSEEIETSIAASKVWGKINRNASNDRRLDCKEGSPIEHLVVKNTHLLKGRLSGVVRGCAIKKNVATAPSFSPYIMSRTNKFQSKPDRKHLKSA